MRRSIPWLLACAIAVPGGALVAQQYSDTTSVVVVEVPVQVTRDGQPVTGLTAENFEILDEGKEQEISGFEVIDLSAEDSAQRMRTMSVAARRHFVFVFDLSFSDPNAVAKARGAAFDLARTSLHPTDLIAVATYSNRTGPRLVLNFTTDRRQVEQAFSTLGLLTQERPIDDPLGIVVDRSGIASDQEAEAEPSDGQGGGRAEGLAPDAEIEAILERLETTVTQSDLRQQVDVFSNTFGFLADMLAPLDGRKHVVFLSEGFDASVLFGTTDQERIVEMQEAVEFGEFWNVDNDERFGSSEALGQMRDVLESFKRADATIHSIDISGVRSDVTEARLARGRQDGLFLLSSQTDGEFYRNYNDLSQAMGEMLERTSVTYLLAFQPTDPRRKAESFHRLRVRLKEVPGGTELSYRQGYFPPAAFSSLDQTQSNLRAAQQMHGDARTGGLAAKVLATPLAGAGKAYVPVMLHVPGSEITSTPLGDELALELYAYAMDEQGVVRDYFAESLQLDVKQVGTALQSAGVKFYGHLDLDPGDYALRVMVRDGRNGSTSVDVTPLVVPDFSQVALNVLPPLFPEGTEHFVAVRETVDPQQPDAVEYPFLFKGQSFIPAIHPVFAGAQVVAVSLVAANAGRAWLEVGALVLAADGAPVPGTFLRVLERERDEGSGLERMIAAFEVPDLPDGEYALVVTMSNGSSGDVESGSLPFSVGRRENAVLFEPPRWMPDLSEIVSQLGPEEGQRTIVKIDRDAVETGYKGALRTLADGRETGAVLELAQLEGGSLNPDDPMSSLAQVGKVQLAVLDQLARRDPELLLPAILLHKEAYSQYRLRKEPYLSVHARRMTLELIDLYAERARSAEASKLASRILTGMAAEVHGSGAHISAQAMFSRALELDATNGVALLGLGFLYESSGRGDDQRPLYDDAIQVLARAVEIEPDLHEARLRLGINLGRVGRMREGAGHLQSLIDRDGVPPWIASLAYQELARLYLKSESYDQARRVLERGVEKIPEDSKLALQLAYVYERCQDQRAANRASANATGQSLSARYLYLKVPQAVEESAVAWLAAATKNLSALAAALPPVTTGVGS